MKSNSRGQHEKKITNVTQVAVVAPTYVHTYKTVQYSIDMQKLWTYIMNIQSLAAFFNAFCRTRRAFISS